MNLTDRQMKNFFSKVDKQDGCWLWTGHTTFGYGRFNLGGKIYTAHRVSCLIHNKIKDITKGKNGAIGELVLHTCDVRNCVNPEHLYVGTQKQNMQDAKLRNRKWNGRFSGAKNPNAKLTQKDIDYIRQSDDVSSQIASMFGIHRTYVNSIKKNKSWATA